LKKTNKIIGILWILLYAFLVLTPLLMLALGPKLSNRPALLDLSVALAFTGLAIMALQFILAGRIKIFNRPFGTDLVYHFHRQIGIASFFMVFSHPILLFILDSRYIRLLNIFTSPIRAKAAVTSLLLLIGVVWTAEYRQKIKMSYKHWKIWHGIFSTAMIALAVVHILLAGNYINLPWKQALWISYSAGFVGILIYTRIIYPLKLIRKSFVVKDIKPEPGDVMTVTMEPDGHEGFKFSPGQFAWMTAWKTPFSDTEHPFSIASSSEKAGSVQMSIKKFGEFTTKIRSLKAGERVYLDGPYGAFNLDRFPTAEKLVFIPGGIGVTPIMSMLRTMADREDTRPILLFYCNREWETLAFSEEIKELESRLNLTTIYTIEKPPQKWDGESGFLNRDILNKHTPVDWISDGTDVFLCGPTPMMNAVERELLVVGYSEKHIHTERYALV
jgi:predicted ferric reductase